MYFLFINIIHLLFYLTNIIVINIGTLQSVQQLQLNDSQTDREMNCMTTKVDEPILNSEADIYIENNKEISSPTQPKTLQQEFSLINMNIPNIEVIYMDIIRNIIDIKLNIFIIIIGQCNGCCRT